MQAPQETYEIRWFSKETLPVDARLACGGFPEERTDFYLHPGPSAGSVKYREDHLETKVLSGALRSVSGEQVAGRASGWLKWSSLWGDSAPPPSMSTNPNSPWRPVHKRRWVHHFGWRGNEIVPTVGDGTPLADFEIAKVTVGDETWSTACIECTGGDRDELARLLVATLYHLEKTGWITGHFSEADSHSYPEWLLLRHS